MATDSSTYDPYNWPALNRKDGMGLSTISGKDEIQRNLRGIDTKRYLSTNLTNLDIPGSSPRIIGFYRNKEDFTNRNDDIERSHSKTLHVKLNKEEYNLTNKDIKYSAPQCVKFITTREPSNPLEPKYKLPPIEEIEPVIPKFIRDNIDVSDIEYTSPKKRFQIQRTGGSYEAGMIPGSSPKKPYIRQTKFDSINYNDVTRDVFKTNRHINPLDPYYRIKYKDGSIEEHGVIDGAKPVTLNLKQHSDPFGLKNSDIIGTEVGSKNRISKFKSSNYNLTNADIDATGASSLKRGITTLRNLNPLEPKYKFPGHLEVNSENNPYGSTLHEKKKVIKMKIPHTTETKKLEKLDSLKSQKSEGRTSDHGNNGNKFEVNEMDKLDINKSVDINNLINQNREIIENNKTGSSHVDAKYKKPDPYFGNLHDKYLISNDITEKFAQKESNTKHLKSM